jgi:glutathione peroxidase
MLTEARPEARSLPGSELRQKLIEHGIQPGDPKDILWNFEKFLVDRRGQVVDRFASDVPPDSEILTAAIERELSAPAP